MIIIQKNRLLELRTQEEVMGNSDQFKFGIFYEAADIPNPRILEPRFVSLLRVHKFLK